MPNQSIYPTFRYRDASSMIDWLVKAFGFAVEAKFEDGGTVGHAELEATVRRLLEADSALTNLEVNQAGLADAFIKITQESRQ